MSGYKTQQYLFLSVALIAVLAAVTSVSATESSPDNNGDPQALIAGNTKKLLIELRNRVDEIKKNEQLAYDLSDDLVVPYLDFPRITRLVVGKHWRTASDTQKKQLIEEVRQMLIRSYVTAMRTYADQILASGNQITYLPSRFKEGDKKAAVRAAIKLQNSTTVDVQYMLYLSENSWRIYDIRVGGISLAITYRTSFSDEIQRSGLDGLINRLSTQNRKGEVDFPGEAASTISNATK
jgi:phospholipid transport system substrate-binding protein